MQAPDQVLRPATDGGLCWRAAPQRGLSRIRLDWFSKFRFCRGLAAGQGRQRKGGARCLCEGGAALAAGRSARPRQTARRAVGQGFGLGRVPGRQKGRQRASTGLFCVLSPSLGVFSLCDPAPARPPRTRSLPPVAIWSDQMRQAKSGSQTHLVLPDDRRNATSSQGAVSKSGPSQDRVRTESGRLCSDINTLAD